MIRLTIPWPMTHAGRGLSNQADQLRAIRTRRDVLAARLHFRSVKRPRSILRKSRAFLEAHPLYQHIAK